jgi:translation initiation factor 1
MAKSKRKNIVYSTNPNFGYQDDTPEENETLQASEQNLRVWLDKHRGGKTATIIRGYIGTASDLKNLATALKNVCAVGGSVKDNEIIIQGDQREKVMKKLLSEGYKAKKAGA